MARQKAKLTGFKKPRGIYQKPTLQVSAKSTGIHFKFDQALA
jgi:hypothetical protein